MIGTDSVGRVLNSVGGAGGLRGHVDRVWIRVMEGGGEMVVALHVEVESNR